MKRRSGDNGIVLAALVVVVAFASVMVFSSVMLAVHSVSRSDAAHKRLKCFYAALAGLSDAVYSCRRQGAGWQSGLELPDKTYLGDKVFFQLKKEQADMLLLDTRSALVGDEWQYYRNAPGGSARHGVIAKLKILELDANRGAILAGLIKNGLVDDVSSTDVRLRPDLDRKEDMIREIAKDKFEQIMAILQQAGHSPYRLNTVSGITVYNAGAPASTMMIGGIDLYWTPGIRLRRIVIGGRTVWAGRRSSPAKCIIMPAVPVPSSGTPIDSLQFDGDARGLELKAVFRMTDGSSAGRDLYPASGKVVLALSSQGCIEGSPVSRSLAAEYDLISGELSPAQEVQDAP